jgi:hypothetical protein
MNKLKLVYISNIKNKVEDFLICLPVYFYKSLMNYSFIRDILFKVPDKQWFSSFYSKQKPTPNKFTTVIKHLCLLYLCFQCFTLQCYAARNNNNSDKFIFLMVYESNKPLTLKKSVLYLSENKWFKQVHDSIVINYNESNGSPDTIQFAKIKNQPVYINLKLYFSEQNSKSNSLFFSGNEPLYEAIVGDSSLRIRAKIAGNNFSNPDSLQGFALILQAILEMILAWLISKTFGLSRHVILMVLAANIAVFPLYLIDFQSIFLKETTVFVGKSIIMILIGLRKMPKYKILLILVALTIIGFGFKELFFFLARIL